MKMQKSKKIVKHQQIYDSLCHDILKGIYKPGQNLPTEKELSEHFNASRPTIAKAMRQLQNKGLIFRRQGQGTFVKQAAVEGKKSLGLLVHWQIQNLNLQADHSGTIFGIMIPEMLHVASSFGHSLLLNDIPEDTADPVERAQKICKRLVDMHVGGVFFTPLELTDKSDLVNQEIASMLDDSGIAVVLLDRDITDSYHRSKYDIVGINNEQSALILTHHIIEAGCKNIDFVTTPIQTTSIADRIRGYRLALEEENLLYENQRVHQLYSKELLKGDPIAIGEELIRLVKEKQTDAFICVNDSTAADLINFFLRNGIRVPEDIKIAGFDDLPTNQYLPVSLTTIRQPIQSLAQESVRTMLDRIENPDKSARDILIRTELIVRESSAAY